MEGKIVGLPEEEYFASGHNACLGCGMAVTMRIVTKAAGKNSIICNATGCLEVTSSLYPRTAWKVPWIHSAFENVAALASGIDAALKVQGIRDKVNLLAIAGDGGTFDIGLQALSGAFERGHKFCYICYDNQAYMNTGVQRSSSTMKYTETSTTPHGTLIHGKKEWQKPLAMILASHGAKYIATASPSYHLDLFNKVQKALSINGPTFIHILSPCIIGWKHETDDAINLARLAVKTNIFPLYEIEDGKVKVNFKNSNPEPITKYLERQGRFKNLNEQEINYLQKRTDEIWKYLNDLEAKGQIFLPTIDW